MQVRPFEWSDLPALHRHRQQSVFLNSALVLTRGPMLVRGALLSYLAPGMGAFTCVSNGDEEDGLFLIGQTIHNQGSKFAHLSFLTPNTALKSPVVGAMLDYMIHTSGERGAFHLLAEADEQTVVLKALRADNFAIYTRQRIWKFSDHPSRRPVTKKWRSTTSLDAIAIRVLYHDLVPGLVQQVEPFSEQQPSGLVHYLGDELYAYVELKFGHRGIWAQPFFHPSAVDIPERFVDLLQTIPNRFSRPVYVCVRSYQSWLETALEELGAEPGERQAVMMKHMAITKKAVQPVALPAMEGRHPEITAPITRTEIE